MSDSVTELIRKWVVSDYFTPNIKAEVILDTLLTEHMGQILKKQLGLDGEPVLLTKEMSLEELPEDGQQPKDDRGSKIDYLLAGECIYLVELKTTDGSIKGKQAERYLRNCCDLTTGNPKTFGKVFGEKLLRIISKLKNVKNGEQWSSCRCMDQAFQSLVGHCNADEHAEQAKQFLKKRRLAATHKYLYTVGQILDRYPDLDALWEKELRLVYITPNGTPPHPKLLSAVHFYLHPKGKESISLREAVRELQPAPGGEAFIDMLKLIISDIYD